MGVTIVSHSDERVDKETRGGLAMDTGEGRKSPGDETHSHGGDIH